MKKLQRSLLLMALLTASLSESSAAILTGTQQTVTRNLVVQGTADATVSITPRTNILAGQIVGGVTLASFDGSTTGGTIAFRLNPTVVQQYSTPTYAQGYLRNNADATQRIEISVSGSNVCIDGGVSTSNVETRSGQWWVCPEGASRITGNIRSVGGKPQTLIGGTYPVAIDVVAWTF